MATKYTQLANHLNNLLNSSLNDLHYPLASGYLFSTTPPLSTLYLAEIFPSLFAQLSQWVGYWKFAHVMQFFNVPAKMLLISRAQHNNSTHTHAHAHQLLKMHSQCSSPHRVINSEKENKRRLDNCNANQQQRQQQTEMGCMANWGRGSCWRWQWRWQTQWATQSQKNVVKNSLHASKYNWAEVNLKLRRQQQWKNHNRES